MQKKIFIFASVIETWRKEAKKFLFKETGGILIGYKDKSGNHVMTHATGPGPNAYHGLTCFEADHKYCQSILDYIFDLTRGELTFMGDWHTHPWGALDLSSRDYKTLIELASDHRAKTPRPIIAIYRPEFYILGHSRKHDFAAYSLQYSSSSLETKSLGIEIINEISNYTLPVIDP
ncbi:MAG: Mov34/MPN/PAD-1 family protein [Thermodesulfobacteriota bacterium]|nr:MAG: Mov34/MPN/PAD-1 family protein [Thermodesulfobacteriota bacterium]